MPLVRATVAAVAAALVAWIGVSVVAAAGTDSGSVSVVDASLKPLASGGSQTGWALTLPSGAACSGDTAHGNYLVNSFLVAASYNLANLHFSATGGQQGDGGPVPGTGGTGFANALYSNTSANFTSQSTAPSTGAVIGLPQFNFANFSVDGSAGVGLPTGSYLMGIACSLNGAVDKFWSTPITFAASTSDPNGEAWTVTQSNNTTTTSSSSTTSPTTTSTSTTSTTRPTTTTSPSSTTSTTSKSSTTSSSTSSTVAGSSTTSTTSAATTGAATSTSTTPGAAVLGAASVSPAVLGSTTSGNSGTSALSAGSSTLPRTGRPVLPMLLAGVGLIYLGYVAVLVSRRRRLAALAALLDVQHPDWE